MTAATSTPVLSRGDSGPAVLELSQLLCKIGVLVTEEPPAATSAATGAPTGSAHFDGALEHAVRTFQQQRGLSVDGVVGPSTMRRLHEARWQLGDRVLSHQDGPMMAGDDVFALQQRLLTLGFKLGRVDGYFGPETKAALQELQRNLGLPNDGTCGPATLKALARLQPRVSGGTPNAMLAEERIRRAGPALSGKVVVLDPAIAPTLGEYAAQAMELLADLTARIEQRLVAIGVQAIRSGPVQSYDEAERAEFANRIGADLSVSLSVDASDNPDAAGCAAYFFGSETHSAHSSTGDRLAGLIHRELMARTDLVDLRTHPKTWDFLRRTRMPAVRVDLGYLSSVSDAARLSRTAFRDTIAEAVVVAIQRFYLTPEVDPNTGVLQLSALREAIHGAS